ncbi:MAG TPA: serpin family protein [Acidimicrobiales bacterium]|nr:serpin family protein [Acidimicrobiales bacterium]
MNSTLEPPESEYKPTPAAELLARAKQRSQAIRRHRLLGASGSLAVVLALVLGGILIPSPAANHPPGQIFVSDRIGSAYELTANETPATSAPSTVVKEVESAEVAFSLELLSHVAGTSDASNELVSPSSLATALAMLELGAAGPTEQGIAATLHTAGLSASEQAAGWQGLAALIAAETSRLGTNLAHVPELNVANALFVQRNFAVLPAFVRALSSEFRTGLWQVDFANDFASATKAINQWTSENTNGLIKKLFAPGAINAFTVLVLADAVYFEAHWAYRFPSATKDLPFHLASGGTAKVPFMTSGPLGSPTGLRAPVVLTKRYVAVELPYAGRKLSALVVMPTQGSLSSFVSSLTAAAFGRLVSSLPSDGADIELSMPTFTLQSNNQLNDPLSSMGMSQAFGLAADFSRITAEPPLQVQTVEQRCYLQVTPKGTTAAAATGIGIQPTSVAAVPRPIVINHPFLFLVRDNSSGAILFEAMVENPAS